MRWPFKPSPIPLDVIKRIEHATWEMCRKGPRPHRTWDDLPVTWLRQCEVCHHWSTPKKVQNRAIVSYRKGCRGGLVDEGHTYRELCMACFNTLKSLERRETSAYETSKLINQLASEIHNAC